MRHLHIIIIAAVDLPEGGGETTRLKTLSMALQAAGHRVNILLENPSGNVSQELLQTQGNFNNIPFRYILGNTKALSGLDFFTSKYRAVKLLGKTIQAIHEKDKIDIVWFNQLAFHTIYPLTKLCKNLGIKTVQSYEDERVNGTGLKRKLIYINQVMADRYMSKKADLIVAISHYLKSKYEKLTEGKVPVCIVPTVADADKWSAGSEKANTPPVLLYYGGFFGFDDIEGMIEAIHILKLKGRKVRLYLVGYNRKKQEYMRSIENLVKTKELESEIELKGFTKHDKLMDYINEANILIGLRKNVGWSQTGLSTKLSEYLSTGRMVICSDVGDNGKYLVNETSAVIMPSSSGAAELAEVIEKYTTDFELRQQIGKNGQQVAFSNFDIRIVKEQLNKLLASIM